MSHSVWFWVVLLAYIFVFATTALICLKSTLFYLADHLVGLFFPISPSKTASPLLPKLQSDLILPKTLSWKTCWMITMIFAGWLLTLTYIFYLFINPPVANGLPRNSFSQFLHYQLSVTDTRHYREIARWGYNNPLDGLNSLAFFPLYPLIMFILSHLGLGYEITGVVFNLFLITIIIKNLYQLVAKTLSPSAAVLTLVLFFAFPVSFFLLLPDTTAIFVTLTLLMFLSLAEKKFARACFFSFLASLTRIQGFLLCIPLALWLIGNIKKLPNWKQKLRKNLLLATAPLGGLVIYLLLNLMIGGSPLAFLTRQNLNWNNQIQNILVTFWAMLHIATIASLPVAIGRWGLILVLFIIVCLTIGYGVKKKFPIHYLAYLLAYLLFSFSISAPISGGRYLFMLWPVFFMQAHFFLKHLKLVAIYLLASLTLLQLMWYFFCFYQGYVVG